VTWYSRKDAADRVGAESSYLVRLVDLGILAPEQPDRFSPGDVRRVLMAKSLEDAGIALEGVAAAIQSGALSLAFLDAPQLRAIRSPRGRNVRAGQRPTRIPLELLMVIREAIGMAQPSPDDRLREDEMAIVPFIGAISAAIVLLPIAVVVLIVIAVSANAKAKQPQPTPPRPEYLVGRWSKIMSLLLGFPRS
jgi:hypothetical protein